MNINTCIPGFDLTFHLSLTSKHLLEACEELSLDFNEQYNSTEYKFVPEAVNEGGILWENWPGKKANEYKSMRIIFKQSPYGHYPLVDPRFGIDPVPLFEVPYQDFAAFYKSPKYNQLAKSTVATFLHATNTQWTFQELETFEDILSWHCMHVSKKMKSSWKKVFKAKLAVVKPSPAVKRNST